jgi:xanthine dehydrogenase YagR molybdenum-binding subunit
MTLETTVNGRACRIEARPDTPAIEVLRGELGLTGTKLVCGGGVCGACTVLVDGRPMTSCLLPASALAGRRVETIEAHAEQGLHPVQRAFMAHDGLQCGFCTPGFVNAAIAFHRSWRSERGTARPTREEIAAALSGHLCRCGAYLGIYEAVASACEGRFDGATATVSPRVEAEAKVTGRAKYTVDVAVEGALEAAILRSPHASARVVAIDLANAEALAGVKAVLSLVDARKRVRYVGQPVAAVAAIDRRTAEDALARIDVTYEIEPAAIGSAAARREGAPLVYPEETKRAPTSAELPPLPARWTGNLRRGRIDLASKRPKKALRILEEARTSAPERVVSGTWHTPAQIHTALEPHACVAKWESREKLVVWVSTQSCWSMALEIGKRFKLRPENVEVRCEYVGGAFGAKQSLTTESFAAIELAKRAGAPVRVVYDRHEEMLDGGYRPATEIELALVAGADGKPAAMCGTIHADAGNAIDSVVAIVLSQVYGVPHRSLRESDVVSHLPPGKPFRAPGGPPANFAIEQAVDMMAERLRVDPIALRVSWDDHAGRRKLYEWAAGLEVWRSRGTGRSGRMRRGVGLAMASWISAYGKKVCVEVASSPEGIAVRCAAQDMGNGARSVLAGAAAEVFGISPLEVRVRIGSSDAPRGVSSSASATTNAVYWPTLEAARIVRDRLVAAAAKQGLEGARAGRGGIDHRGGHVPWRELLAGAPPASATVKRGTDPGIDPMSLLPVGSSGATIGKGMAGGLCIAEVEVDTRLGRVIPRRFYVGVNAGKIVVPALAKSQIYGGVIQGIGYALYEEREIDPNTGHVLSANLEDYRLPGIGDVSDIEVHFEESGFEHVKGGAAGLSELSTVPIAAAIANAVHDATGFRPMRIPIRPEHVLAGVP